MRVVDGISGDERNDKTANRISRLRQEPREQPREKQTRTNSSKTGAKPLLQMRRSAATVESASIDANRNE